MKDLLNTYLLITLGIFILVISGCDTQELLNEGPPDEITSEEIWQDGNLVELYVNDIYLEMGHGFHWHTMLTAMTDDAMFTHNQGTFSPLQSVISPGNLGAFGNGRLPYFMWENLYSGIRKTNIFLENIESSPIVSDQKQRLKGEVHFLRSYFYHNLLRIYGGVPIITEAYELNDDMEVPRNSFSETVDFIVEEAETASELLPFDTDLGRANKGAAMALKARVLLYAASDLYNDNPENELVGYVSGSQQERWRTAKNAAQELMNTGQYSLYDNFDDPVENYTQLFLTQDNEENIMSRYFLSSRNELYDPGLGNGPNGYHNWGGNTPMQQLVDAYEMEDGTYFNWNNPEHAEAPYEDRDPRFYSSILYDGAQWRERPSDVAELEPQGIIQTFTRVTLPDGSTQPGVDTRNSPIEDWNGGFTGYYLRKFIDPSINHQFEVQEVPWRFFRYAEVLLNYAEASIELGEEGEARDVINKIRSRAGMPDVTDTGDDLVDRYRNERRVEMAYEEQRFFDMRRWKIAPNIMNENGKGIDIRVEATDYTDRETYFNYQYNIIDVQNRSWDDKFYFVPIPEDEMNRNDELIQNPGYD